MDLEPPAEFISRLQVKQTVSKASLRLAKPSGNAQHPQPLYFHTLFSACASNISRHQWGYGGSHTRLQHSSNLLVQSGCNLTEFYYQNNLVASQCRLVEKQKGATQEGG